MQRRLLTFSKLETAMSCQWFLRPEVQWTDSTPFEDAVDFGSHCHHVFETYAKKGPQAAALAVHTWPSMANMDPEASVERTGKVATALSQFTIWFEAYVGEALNLDVDPGYTVGAEVAICYNPFKHTARLLAGQEKRDYSNVDPECEVAGTADLVLTGRRRVEVIDYKTGSSPPAADCPQLVGLATAFVALHDDGKSADTSVLHCNHDVCSLVTLPVTDMDVAVMQDTMVGLLTTDIANSVPVPNGGCVFCPARLRCPAYSDAVNALAPQPGTGFKIEGAVESMAHAAWLVTALGIATERIAETRTALEAFAGVNGQVPLGNGKVYKPVSGVKAYPKLDQKAIDYLERAGVAAALTRSTRTTWHAIKLIAGAERYKKIREDLQALGAVLNKRTTVYRTVAADVLVDTLGEKDND